MRFLILAFTSLLFFNCKSQATHADKHGNQNEKFYMKKNCLDDGSCSIKVLHDSSLTIKNDETGKLYPEINPGNNIIIKYEYKKNTPKNTVDGEYSELIFMELNPAQLNLSLQDKKLQEVKLLYGRICFCRDATGYFKVTKGNLMLKEDKNNLDIQLHFSTGKIPQKINSIIENIQL